MTGPVPDMSLRRVLRGIGCSLTGVAVMLRTQRSARIHLLFTILVCGLAAVLRLPIRDWCWLLLAISMVWSAEAANTAIEFLADVVCPHYHDGIRNTKDVAAAAVFFVVIGAVAIGFLVLAPPLWAWASALLTTQGPP
jgi:diacylglycerol kinase (ATP)